MKTILIRLQSLLLSIVILIGCQQQEKENLLTRRSPIQEPYEYISGGSLTGANVPDSPDPLVRYVWDNPKATDPYQIFVMLPTSCMGAVAFKHALGLKIGDARVTVAETSTLPYAVRITGPAKIEVYNRLPAGCLLAALPQSRVGS